jgi:hypothetical protein
MATVMMTVNVKAMDSQRWICRIQWFSSLGSRERVDGFVAHHLRAEAHAAQSSFSV